MIFETVEWHHGTIGESCSSDGSTPVSAMGKARLRLPIEHGKLKGKVGIYAGCPKCGRWVRIGAVWGAK